MKKTAKKTKEIMKSSEEKEKTLAIFNSFTAGLMLLDEKNRIIQTNPQLENMFGIKKEEIERENLKDLKENPLFSKVAELVLDEKGIKEIKNVQFSPKKKLFIELTSTPVINNRKKTGYLLIFNDISRQKLVEDLKTEFIMLAAHQLRTPLAGIRWNLKMLINGDFGQFTPEQKAFLEKNYENNERMIKLVNDLLDSTKIEEGRYLYYKTQEDIVKITEEVIVVLQDEIKKRSLQLEFKKPKGKIPKIKIDKEKIGICIQNLMINAIRYNRVGGKVIVSVEYNKGKNKILISVEDTGIGIPKEQQKRIFTKFYRSTAAMKAETVGSGLGLYMTKNIIEAHRGRIWFESEEGKGSVFYFSLPVGD